MCACGVGVKQRIKGFGEVGVTAFLGSRAITTVFCFLAH